MPIHQYLEVKNISTYQQMQILERQEKCQMNKKIEAITLSVVFLLSFTGCVNNDDEKNKNLEQMIITETPYDKKAIYDVEQQPLNTNSNYNENVEFQVNDDEDYDPDYEENKYKMKTWYSERYYTTFGEELPDHDFVIGGIDSGTVDEYIKMYNSYFNYIVATQRLIGFYADEVDFALQHYDRNSTQSGDFGYDLHGLLDIDNLKELNNEIINRITFVKNSFQVAAPEFISGVPMSEQPEIILLQNIHVNLNGFHILTNEYRRQTVEWLTDPARISPFNYYRMRQHNEDALNNKYFEIDNYFNQLLDCLIQH